MANPSSRIALACRAEANGRPEENDDTIGHKVSEVMTCIKNITINAISKAQKNAAIISHFRSWFPPPICASEIGPLRARYFTIDSASQMWWSLSKYNCSLVFTAYKKISLAQFWIFFTLRVWALSKFMMAAIYSHHSTHTLYRTRVHSTLNTVHCGLRVPISNVPYVREYSHHKGKTKKPETLSNISKGLSICEVWAGLHTVYSVQHIAIPQRIGCLCLRFQVSTDFPGNFRGFRGSIWNLRLHLKSPTRNTNHLRRLWEIWFLKFPSQIQKTPPYENPRIFKSTEIWGKFEAQTL